MAGDTMSRRPLLHPVSRLAKAQQRMAPGGLLWSESPIPRRHSPRVQQMGDDAVLPQFWWKFDEASGLFTDTVAGSATLDGHGNAGYHAPPLAPGSTFAASTAVSIDCPLGLPAVTPGPGGWIVFDWWVSNLDMTLTGATVRAVVTRFNSTDTTVGSVRVLWVAEPPSPLVKRLRFCIGGPTFTDPGILTIDAPWDNPAHFQWKINPTTGGWQILMGGTSIGSGTVAPYGWGGTWSAQFAAVDVASYWDEFKVYGE